MFTVDDYDGRSRARVALDQPFVSRTTLFVAAFAVGAQAGYKLLWVLLWSTVLVSSLGAAFGQLLGSFESSAGQLLGAAGQAPGSCRAATRQLLTGSSRQLLGSCLASCYGNSLHN